MVGSLSLELTQKLLGEKYLIKLTYLLL